MLYSTININVSEHNNSFHRVLLLFAMIIIICRGMVLWYSNIRIDVYNEQYFSLDRRKRFHRKSSIGNKRLVSAILLWWLSAQLVAYAHCACNALTAQYITSVYNAFLRNKLLALIIIIKIKKTTRALFKSEPI